MPDELEERPRYADGEPSVEPALPVSGIKSARLITTCTNKEKMVLQRCSCMTYPRTASVFNIRHQQPRHVHMIEEIMEIFSEK